MVTTELGACEWFVWDLRRSNLIDRGRLDQVIGDYLGKNPRAEPPALADYLVGQGILTAFQAERLLQGKTQGFVLGPFTLMDALGAGSMGTVYKAQSKTDSNWYAVKVLPRRSMWNVRIARRKVRAFEQCRHPSVVPFVDVGTAGGMHYLAWPFVEGDTLEKQVQQQGKLAASLTAWLALQVAEGLETCHQHGLFHGLLKPSNLMLGPDNQLFILDLGIGTLLAETEGESLVDTMSTANAVTSGLDCASPESIMDPTNLTPTGDQYSLGCVLYYALAGQYPFPDGSAAEKMMAHQFKEPKPLSELCPEAPPDLVAVVQRLMQKAPENRFGGMAEVVEALKPLADKGQTPRPLEMLRQPARAAAARDKVLPLRPTASTASDSRTGPAAPRSVSPSTPTPRPPSLNSLPSRSSVRVQPAPAPAAAASVPAAPEKKEPEREIPGGVPGLPEGSFLEDRLGPLGITLGAIAACALVWVLAVVFRLF
jgi:serine/threonine-protein kinase